MHVTFQHFFFLLLALFFVLPAGSQTSRSAPGARDGFSVTDSQELQDTNEEAGKQVLHFLEPWHLLSKLVEICGAYTAFKSQNELAYKHGSS